MQESRNPGLRDQVVEFMARLNATTTEYSFADYWKMMTIMIGGNNLCHLCADPEANSPQTFGRLLEESIDLLYDQVPRLFINLVPPPSPVILHAYASCTSLLAPHTVTS